MFRQLDFRSFFNFLGRNKLYTAINIFGLSLSLMFVILIADYTVRQLTVDSFHSKAGRIYVVSNENTVASAYFLQKHLLDRYPEIEATCAVSFEDHHTVEADGKLALADVLYADTTFFRIFDFELAAGDRRQALAARDNVVLSESFARRMFGDADPVGRSLVAEGKSYTVSAVMRDIERSVIPPVDLLYRGEWEAAAQRLLMTNSFPEFTGRVCPAPCEGACTCGIHQPQVTIRQNELSIIENAFALSLIHI